MIMWHTKEIREIERELKTNTRKGLTEEEAEKRLQSFGKNKLADKKRENILIKFIKQFNDFMIIILIIASIISAVVAKLDGSEDYIDSIIIIAIVVFNSIMGLIQEAKAEKSLEALKTMTAPVCKVKRNGKIITVKGTEVVPGDIVILEAGNYVPADARIITCSNLKIEESSLTGETVPVLKEANIVLKDNIPIGDTINMVFSSTIVVNGHGEAIVTETGMDTKVGKIAKMIITDESPQTPIQKKLADVGKTLGIGCIIICISIFIIGIFKKISPMEMFMTSVGLAVAAIPEGLPAIVTIMLSIGVTKMAKKNSIIRKLPAVETLGSSSVICSDKTGTLTQNKMKVVEIVTSSNLDQNNIDMRYNVDNSEDREKQFILELGSMCTDTNIQIEKGERIVSGEPTEIAIVNEALERNIDKIQMYKTMERIGDIPFDSTRKMMSTIHRNMGMYRIITKGAPDVIINKCTKYKHGTHVLNLDEKVKRKIEKLNSQMAEKALRVIAVAYKDLNIMPNNLNSENIEKELIFVGLIGMIDPPREGVKEAVSTCRRAGIKTVMITGDHIVTAKAIAKNLGILRMNELAITGEELDKISEEVLAKNIMKYSVFARVSPEHKVRIVRALRKTGAIVAKKGNGVNDATA